MKQGNISTGHPVNVATGIVYSIHEDISIPGRVPLDWDRRYSTSLLDTPLSSLGPRWTTRYFATLTFKQGQYELVSPEGEIEIFNDPKGSVEREGIIRNLATFQEVTKSDDHYIITRWDVDTGEVERFVFKKGAMGREWPLTSIEDITGQGLDLERDEAGRLSAIRQRLEKRALCIEYTVGNRIGSISFLMPNEKRQVLVRYEYDKSGRMITAYDALGYADQFEYDSKSRIIREFRKDGGVFTFKYDDKGRCVKTSGLDRYDEKSFRYFDHIGWTEVTNSLGYVTRYKWLSDGQVVCEVNPLGAQSLTDYDEYGRIIAQTDPNDATFKYGYDKYGNRCTMTDPLGHITMFTFNKDHLPVELRNAKGDVWKQIYNNSNCLVSIEDPLGACWQFGYNLQKDLVQITDPQKFSRRRILSDHGSVVELTDWEGKTTRYRLDAFGRTAERLDPDGSVHRFGYDAIGNLVSLSRDDRPSITCKYDPGGNLISLRDIDGPITTSQFGPCGRLIETRDNLGNQVRFIWDPEPKMLKEIINEKEEIYQFVYNPSGNIIQEIGFDGTIVTFEYDPAGNCVGVTNGSNERIDYKLDPMGRKVKEILPDGNVNTFNYDALGNIVGARGSESELSWQYDSVGRVTKELQGDAWIVREYDLAGNMTQMRTSLGLDLSYVYNANGMVSKLRVNKKHSFEFLRNARQRETTRCLNNRVKLVQEFDTLGQLLEQRVLTDGFIRTDKITSIGAIIARSYVYDNKAQLISVTEKGIDKTSYDYDGSGQLVKVTRGFNVIEQFKYDVRGNIIEVGGFNIEKERLEYEPGDRLIRRGTTWYSYDESGRVTKKIENGESSREWLYSWDAKDRLCSMTDPHGSVWRYAYDPLGRRIAKKGPKGNIRFIWDGDVVVHEVHDGLLENSWIFDPGDFRPLGLLHGGSIYAIIHDHLGTPREILDSFNNIVWSTRLRTWGQIEKHRTQDLNCPIRFQGQWHDEESDLHYSLYRYYDPTSGRFISPDPLRYLGNLHAYRYVLNPLTSVDPLGLTPSDPFEGIVADLQRKAAEEAFQRDMNRPKLQKEFQDELYRARIAQAEARVGKRPTEMEMANLATDILDDYIKSGGPIPPQTLADNINLGLSAIKVLGNRYRVADILHIIKDKIRKKKEKCP